MQFQTYIDIQKEVREHIEKKKRDGIVRGGERAAIQDDASFFISKT